MTRATHKDPSRVEALQALEDSGRRQSTAMILFHTNLSKRVGIGTTEEKVLELITRHEHPTVGDLAGQTGLAKNSISDVLDRLESKGFVSRRPHPDDGRKVAIVIEEEGAAKIGRLFVPMLSRLGELHEDYSNTELRLIAEYQRRAAEIQTQEAKALAL